MKPDLFLKLSVKLLNPFNAHQEKIKNTLKIINKITTYITKILRIIKDYNKHLNTKWAD